MNRLKPRSCRLGKPTGPRDLLRTLTKSSCKSKSNVRDITKMGCCFENKFCHDHGNMGVGQKWVPKKGTLENGNKLARTYERLVAVSYFGPYPSTIFFSPPAHPTPNKKSPRAFFTTTGSGGSRSKALRIPSRWDQ